MAPSALLTFRVRSFAPDDVSALFEQMIDELRALAPRERIEELRIARLPLSAMEYGVRAAPLFRALIDDPATFNERTVLALIAVGTHDDLAFLIERFASLSTPAQLHLLTKLDSAEVYEIVEPHYWRDAPLREQIRSHPLLVADERFIDLVLRGVTTSARDACLLLAVHPAPRAFEELTNLFSAAPSLDATAWSAVEALVMYFLRDRTWRDPRVAHFVEQIVMHAEREQLCARDDFTLLITTRGPELLQIVENESAREVISRALARRRPMVIG